MITYNKVPRQSQQKVIITLEMNDPVRAVTQPSNELCTVKWGGGYRQYFKIPDNLDLWLTHNQYYIEYSCEHIVVHLWFGIYGYRY